VAAGRPAANRSVPRGLPEYAQATGDQAARADTLDGIERSRRVDGHWLAQRQRWKPLNGSMAPEADDRGRSGEPSDMITLSRRRVPRAAGRCAVRP
jgi:hypothetical protein